MRRVRCWCGDGDGGDDDCCVGDGNRGVGACLVNNGIECNGQGAVKNSSYFFSNITK